MKVTFEVDVDMVGDDHWPLKRQEMLRLAKSTELASAVWAIVQWADSLEEGGMVENDIVKDAIRGIVERRGLFLDELYT